MDVSPCNPCSRYGDAVMLAVGTVMAARVPQLDDLMVPMKSEVVADVTSPRDSVVVPPKALQTVAP